MRCGAWMFCPACGERVNAQIDHRLVELHPQDEVVAIVNKQAAGHGPACERKYAERTA